MTRSLKQTISRGAMSLALVTGVPALGQSTEDQSAAKPAPAEDAANLRAGQNNSSGPSNQGNPAAQGAAPSLVADADRGVGEIVVTAQFREQNLQKTPLAITAVSGAMLEARGQTNIAQVASEAPSVTLKPQGAAFGPSLGASIRGIGQFDFNPALEPGVGVYVDDVYFATLTGSIFDLLDLDRVEVLRGPQGTLSGKNSIGGAIKLYSKKPTGDGTGYVSATYGSRNRVDLRGSVDFKIADGLFARVSGVAKRQDGYIKDLDFGCVYPAGTSPLNPAGGVPRQRSAGESCVLGKEGEVNYQAIRGQLRWLATEAIEVNVIGDFTRDVRRSAGSVLTVANYTGTGDIDPYAAPIPLDSRFICGKYCNYATFSSPGDATHAPSFSEDRVDYTGYGVSGTIDWKLADNLALKSIIAYRNYTSIFGNDDDFTPLAHSLGRSDLTFHSVSEELRLNGSFGTDDRLEYTVGGFYLHQRSVYVTFQDLRYAGLTPFDGDDPVPATTKAVFAHASYHLTTDLTLTGGIRYTDESKDYTFSRLSPDGTLHPLLGGLTGVTGHYANSRVDYRANAQYQFTPDVMAYAQFSTGFKGGGINPRPFFPTQVQPFNPETIKSYEIGLKTELFDRKVRLNLAGFLSQYNDIQLALLSCPQFSPFAGFPCALPANVGDAIIKGGEAEISARPTEALTIDASLSYVDFKYRGSSAATLATAGISLGDTTPYNPKWKWSAGIQYAIPLGDNIGSITPRIDASYQSAIYTDPVNAPSNFINHYATGNARLTYRNPRADWEAALEVTNFTNKYYYLTSFDLTGAGAGIASAQPGRPREWALSVKKSF
ncbi:MAG: TonB-dependent receptor [Janthinobacterium lividum]